ncbi:putative transmembrane protein, partial [Toxoplasma gondii p89]
METGATESLRRMTYLDLPALILFAHLAVLLRTPVLSPLRWGHKKEQEMYIPHPTFRRLVHLWFGQRGMMIVGLLISR